MRTWIADRKLSATDRQAKREGFVKQVEMLQGENRNLLADQTGLRREYDDYRHLCQAETQSLRDNIQRLEGDVYGLRRRIDYALLEFARIAADRPDLIAKLAEAFKIRDERHPV